MANDQIQRNYIHFSSPINTESANALVKCASDVANQYPEVHLLVNSPGGNVQAGVHCYNMMRALPTELTTYNVGNVDSIANVLFLAGNQRIAAPTSVFMFHSVGFEIQNPIRLDEKVLRERLNSIVSDHNRIGNIVAERSSLSVEDTTQLFVEQKVRDAAWAAEHGIAHEVALPAIPKNVQIVQVIAK